MAYAVWTRSVCLQKSLLFSEFTLQLLKYKNLQPTSFIRTYSVGVIPIELSSDERDGFDLFLLCVLFFYDFCFGIWSFFALSAPLLNQSVVYFFN